MLNKSTQGWKKNNKVTNKEGRETIKLRLANPFYFRERKKRGEEGFFVLLHSNE